MATFVGTGTRYYGRDRPEADGSYVATSFLVLFFIPLYPLHTERVKYHGMARRRPHYEIVCYYPLRWSQARSILLRGWATLSALLVAAAVLTWVRSAHAAPPPDFLRSYAVTRGFQLGRPVQPRPTPDGKAVLFLRSLPRSPELSLYEYSTESGATRELAAPATILRGAAEQLSSAERARRERMRQTLRGFASFELSHDGAAVLLQLSGRLYLLQRRDGQVRELPTGAGLAIDPHLSPDGRKVAYVRERDLYALDLATGHEQRLTQSGDSHITNGLAEFVAQEEMDRHSGFWWAPTSDALAFEEVDGRGVEELYLGDLAHPEAPPVATAYPRAGRANVVVRIGLVSLREGTPTWMEWDRARYPYLASVVWQRGGPLTLVVESRDQRELVVLAAEKEGHTHALLTERDAAWLNLDQTVPRWLEDGSGFLWSSEREGAWQLELRRKDGQLVRRLVRDPGYAGLVHVDDAAGQAFFIGSSEPSEDRLLRVSLHGGAPVQLTQTSGVHRAEFARHSSVYTVTSTSLAELSRTTVHRAEQTLGELPSVAESAPFAARAEIVSVGSQQFRVLLVRPHDFVPARRYPVVVHAYGGPHHRQVVCALGPQLLRQWIADQGFVVVAIDGRGTPRRGRSWERSLQGSFGDAILADQISALDALGARFHELDLDRVGIYGWSFGGYLSALALLQRPDRFRAAVSGAPVVDWRDYDTHYTERYLGLPAENAAGYGASSLLTHASANATLERPLLLIHGTSDDNVYFFHSLKLADALFRAGRPFELLPLSGLTHMVPDPIVQERLQQRIVGFLARALQ